MPHVDTEFQGRRGHHATQPPGLEVLLDQAALVLGHRTVVRAGQHGGGSFKAIVLPGDVRELTGRLGIGGRNRLGRLAALRAGGRIVEPELVDLVEPRGELFGQPAGVGENNRGAVLLHQVHDPFLHVRPDRGGRLVVGGLQVRVDVRRIRRGR